MLLKYHTKLAGKAFFTSKNSIWSHTYISDHKWWALNLIQFILVSILKKIVWIKYIFSVHLKFSLIKYKKKNVTESKTGDQNKIPQIITWIIHSLNIIKFSPFRLYPRHTIQISSQMRAFCSDPFGVVDSSCSWMVNIWGFL